MHGYLNEDIKISRVLNAVAAGTTDQNGTAVDMTGFDGVMFIAAFGALVAVFGWQVSELNSQSFSPALDLNLRWLYLSSVVGGVLIVIYSLASIADGWGGRWPGLHGPGEP